MPHKDTGWKRIACRPRILNLVAQRPVAPPEIPPITRQERVIVYMFASILGLSILAIIALFIAGVNAKGALWSIVQILPLIGLPLSVILLVVLVILNGVRRSRAAKVASK